MAQSSWPLPPNRIVNEQQYEWLAQTYGPAAGILGDLSPTLVYGDASGFQARVRKDFFGQVHGYGWTSGTVDWTLPITQNTSGSTRVDLVVLRLRRATWAVTLEVIQGTPGGGAPALTQNMSAAGIWDLPIAVVTQINNAPNVSAADVVYVAPHLSSDGSGYRIPATTPVTTALSYVPTPYDGMEVRVAAAGGLYRREAGTWREMFSWIAFTPLLYTAMSTTPTVVGSTPIAGECKYARVGDVIMAHANVTANGASTNGGGISLPVPAPQRLFGIGTAGLFGATTPADQCGLAVMSAQASNDKLVVIAYSNGFRDFVSSNSFRYNVVYPAA